MSDRNEPIYSIGETAKKLGIIVPALRVLEKVNLLLTARTEYGKRLYSDCDIEYIHAMIILAEEKELTLETLKDEITELNCWEILECEPEIRRNCPQYKNKIQPCWAREDITCDYQASTCYECPVYRAIPQALGLKVVC